jgi:hypothetical protein
VNYDEPTASQRRIPAYLVDTSGDPVTGVTLSGTDVQVSLSGASFVNGSGTIAEVGDGLYYYQATQAETVTTAYLMLKITDAAIANFVWVEDIGTRIELDEAFGETRRIPIYLIDSAGDPVTGADLDVANSLEVSLNGDAYITAVGTWAEVGSGAYYYEADATEVAEIGFLVLKVVSAGAETYVYTASIVDATTAETPGTSGYFGYYFGTGGVETTAVAPVVAPTPVEADVTASEIVYTDHLLAAVARLPQYAKSKVTDGDE